MTTKVVIACPENSLHNALVYVENKDANGDWTRAADPIIVEPREQAEPVYLTSGARIVIEEDTRARPEQQ